MAVSQAGGEEEEPFCPDRLDGDFQRWSSSSGWSFSEVTLSKLLAFFIDEIVSRVRTNARLQEMKLPVPMLGGFPFRSGQVGLNLGLDFSPPLHVKSNRGESKNYF